MGLAISVYTEVKKEKEEDENTFEVICDHKEFEDRMSKLNIGSYYSGIESDHEFSYPYSYHKTFREFLLSYIGKNWETIDDNDPFFEFIIFYDDRGCIDWHTSKKLYADFETHIEKINALCLKGNSFYHSKLYDAYLNWLEAFKIASENRGVVLYS